jgi:hypothetical protein
MSSRKSIYLSDQAEAVIGTDHDSLSGRINNICIRYGTITAAGCPELRLSEWLMICDMLNATVMDAAGADQARHLWADIAESGKLDGLAEKWEIDTEDLSQRVRAMSYAGQVAIIEVVGKFWRHPKLNELSSADLLREVGAKIK